MPDHDPDTLARIYAATDYGHGVWQMLDAAMISDEWDRVFEDVYRQRFREQPLPPGLSHPSPEQRIDFNEKTYQEVEYDVHNAALGQMIHHHVMVTVDCADFSDGLEPAAAAALEAALTYEGTEDR